jgi:ABC-type Mn2+/Zn2+ transport system permease subunit
MLDALTDPFSQSIAQRALLEVILLGAVCGPLGVWVALYRQSYAAESIAHAALPGMVAASLTGLPIVLGAGAGLLVAAIAISLVGRLDGIGPDVSVAVAVTTLFGAGTLLALAPEVPARLGELLFGDPLAVTSGDLIATAALVVAILGALAVTHRLLLVSGFDPVSAPNLGARPAAAGLLLLVLLAATTAIAVQALGNLLVVALVIAPGAAALRVTARLSRALALSVALAVSAGIGGIYLSHYLELAAGASIALLAVAWFVLSLPFGSASRRRSGHTGSAVETVGAAA